MHLRSRRISDQHQSLISLEGSGNDVFYVAPSFHTTSRLNSAYADHEVWNRSFRIRPSEIGPLADDGPHHVTFLSPTGQWRFYSENPSTGGRALGSEEIATMPLQRIRERGERSLREQLPDLDHTLLTVVKERNAQRNERERIDVQELVTEVDLLRRAAYIARQLVVSVRKFPFLEVSPTVLRLPTALCFSRAVVAVLSTSNRKPGLRRLRWKRPHEAVVGLRQVDREVVGGVRRFAQERTLRIQWAAQGTELFDFPGLPLQCGGTSKLPKSHVQPFQSVVGAYRAFLCKSANVPISAARARNCAGSPEGISNRSNFCWGTRRSRPRKNTLRVSRTL